VRLRLWLVLGGAALLAVLAAAAWVWRDDIARTLLDPRQPYQTYDPPRAPDYRLRAAWALLPGPAGPDPAAADVFFVHPTTYDGGEHWNAPIGEPDADRVLVHTMLPNYAGPYQRIARVFAPRYRQASLYTLLTLRDDARDARAFAYRDVREAFRAYLARHNGGRPFLIVGVEQGGTLAARLVAEEVLADPAVAGRFAGAHLLAAAVPVDALPGCRARGEAGCVVAWMQVRQGDEAHARRLLERALVWRGGRLENLAGPALCVNPLLGRRTIEPADAAQHLGAANATGLEWGTRPGLLRRQAAARCVDGVLRVAWPHTPSLEPRGGWAERRRMPGFNLFYADLETDAAARLAALDGAKSPVLESGRAGVTRIP
jgi:hypothetical protein